MTVGALNELITSYLNMWFLHQEQNDETFYDPASGACLLGLNLKGTLVPSPYTGELHDGTNLQHWFAPGFTMNPGTIAPCFDMHVPEAALVQYGID